MSALDLFCWAVLTACWTMTRVALQVQHGHHLNPAHDPPTTGQTARFDVIHVTFDVALFQLKLNVCMQFLTVSGCVVNIMYFSESIKGERHKVRSSETGDLPHHAPCLVDDIFAALRDAGSNSGELTNHSLTLFGICTSPENSQVSVLLELTTAASRNQRSEAEVVHPARVHFTEEDESDVLKLTFDLPQSTMLQLNPVLLLALQSPPTGGNLGVTFTSQSLHPGTQNVCVTGGTQYMMLTGKASPDSVHQTWRITVDAKSPDMKQNLKDLLIGGETGRSHNLTPLLLFPGERGTDTRLVFTFPTETLTAVRAVLSIVFLFHRYTHASGLSPPSSHATYFLCELRRFLTDVMPQAHSESPPLQLNSLQSLPPLKLDTSSSQTLLAELIKSSAFTIFSFTSCCSTFHAHHGELALSPVLLEELRQRLEQTVIKVMEVIRVEEVGHRAMERLGRLTGLSAFLKDEAPAGESQYRAFLLLKALQTVARTYEAKRGLRAARAGVDTPAMGNACGLKSLIVSLERHVFGPNTANINNCHGYCNTPMVNPSNHVVLLSSHISSERAAGRGVEERAPCCVPLAYEAMEMVLLNEDGADLKHMENVVAKECGCR
ncbi:uncharacterized protein V6R79_003990 [Siganus canaliculatus]